MSTQLLWFHSLSLTTRPDREWLEITVHIGQTIWVVAIFLYANRVNTLELCTLFDFALSIYISVFGTETISSCMIKRQYLFRTHFSHFILSRKHLEISIWHKSFWKLYWSELVTGRKTGPESKWVRSGNTSDNHTLQTNPRHREKESHNIYNNKTSISNKSKATGSLSLFKMIAKLEMTHRNA